MDIVKPFNAMLNSLGMDVQVLERRYSRKSSFSNIILHISELYLYYLGKSLLLSLSQIAVLGDKVGDVDDDLDREVLRILYEEAYNGLKNIKDGMERISINS